jgi:CO/xanthine dehydrogenase FAD-binding subunit
MGRYWRPSNLAEALQILRHARPCILAGGTRLVRGATAASWDVDLLDITAIPALHGMTPKPNGGWRIGAATTWTALLEAPLPALHQAAATVASPQVRHQATIGGNIAARFASADGVPALLALDAKLELVSADASRRLRLADFLAGEALAPDELLTAIIVPAPPCSSYSAFAKHGSRQAVNVAEVTAAVRIDIAAGRVHAIALALGGCVEAAERLPGLEARLRGLPATPALASLILPQHLAHLPLLDDFRAPATYRQDVAVTLLRRLVATLTSGDAA